MGIDYYVDVGPYLIGKPKTEQITENYYACNNEKCVNYDEEKSFTGKFCIECGGPITELEKVTTVSINAYEACEEINEKFAPVGNRIYKEKHILVLNQDVDGVIHDMIDVKESESTGIEIDSNSVTESIEIIKKEYAHELETLKKYYDELDVKFGVIFHMN
jgi:hypothetical protein